MIASLAVKRPILWTQDILATHSLNEYFRTGCKGSEVEPGHHIIALEDELLIRQLARKLQEIEGTT
jgi:hypothetical protein